jgi:hypothetical protein
MNIWVLGWEFKENYRGVTRNNCKVDVVHLPIDCFKLLKGWLLSGGVQNNKKEVLKSA